MVKAASSQLWLLPALARANTSPHYTDGSTPKVADDQGIFSLVAWNKFDSLCHWAELGGSQMRAGGQSQGKHSKHNVTSWIMDLLAEAGTRHISHPGDHTVEV